MCTKKYRWKQVQAPNFKKILRSEGQKPCLNCGNHNTVTMAMETTEKSVTEEPNIKQAATIEANCVTGVSETKDQGPNPLSHDNFRS